MSFSDFLMKAYDKALDLMFPKNIKCIFCDRDLPKENRFLTCNECMEILPYNKASRCLICDDMLFDDQKDYEPKEKSDEEKEMEEIISSDLLTGYEMLARYNIICEHCKKRHPYFDIARAPFRYQDDVAKVIIRLKEKDAHYLAKPLAQYMALTYKNMGIKADIILPVPMHPKAEKARGYNQTILLSEELSKLLNIPYSNQYLFKIKDTKPLKTLNSYERFTSIKNAFSLSCGELLDNKVVLLVDDILTTGATANACAKTIKTHAKKVYVLTAARTTRLKD